MGMKTPSEDSSSSCDEDTHRYDIDGLLGSSSSDEDDSSVQSSVDFLMIQPHEKLEQEVFTYSGSDVLSNCSNGEVAQSPLEVLAYDSDDDEAAPCLYFPLGESIGLPDCEGPKLYPFRPFGRVEDLEFIREVAVTNLSAVWKVKVEGVFYALKVFGLPLAEDYTARWLEKDELQDRVDYHDCFNCECRAYGRLQETTNEDIAVPCHGYVLLTSQQEMRFRSLSSKSLNVLQRDARQSGTPLRAILKDWVEEGTVNFEPRMIRRMKHELKRMHSVGIVNRDIKQNNYLGGKLFDFGLAWTVPHERVTKMLDSLAQNAVSSREELDDERYIDQSAFDFMVDEWNEEHGPLRIWERQYPNSKYSNLRSRRSDESPELPPLNDVDPFRYDWRSASMMHKETGDVDRVESMDTRRRSKRIARRRVASQTVSRRHKGRVTKQGK